MKILLLILCIPMWSVPVNKETAQTPETGDASYYSDVLEGNKTASGELYDPSKMTAAHPTLPFQTKIRVTNLVNQRSVIVMVNDRGPYTGDRIVDLSKAAAIALDFVDRGVTRVQLEVIPEE